MEDNEKEQKTLEETDDNKRLSKKRLADSDARDGETNRTDENCPPPAKRQASESVTTIETPPVPLILPEIMSNRTVSDVAVVGENNSTEMLRIRQAVCVMCGKDIPNLYDVVDNSVDDSNLAAAAAHRCEKCSSPNAEQEQDFIFAGPVERQTSVEEVVVISDEESVVITLSSSEDDVIVQSTSAEQVKRKVKSRKALQESSSKKGNQKDLVIHPKYNLLKENMSGKSKKQTRKAPLLSVNSSSDSDDGHSDSTSVSVSEKKSFECKKLNSKRSEICDATTTMLKADEIVCENSLKVIERDIKMEKESDGKSKPKHSDEGKEKIAPVKEIENKTNCNKVIVELKTEDSGRTLKETLTAKDKVTDEVDGISLDNSEIDSDGHIKRDSKSGEDLEKSDKVKNAGDADDEEINSELTFSDHNGKSDISATESEVINAASLDSHEINDMAHINDNASDDTTTNRDDIKINDASKGEVTIERPRSDDSNNDNILGSKLDTNDRSFEMLIEEIASPSEPKHEKVETVANEIFSSISETVEKNVFTIRNTDKSLDDASTEANGRTYVSNSADVEEGKFDDLTEGRSKATLIKNEHINRSETMEPYQDSTGDVGDVDNNIALSQQVSEKHDSTLKIKEALDLITQSSSDVELKKSKSKNEKDAEKSQPKSLKKKKKSNNQHLQGMCNFLSDFNFQTDPQPSKSKAVEEATKIPFYLEQEEITVEKPIESTLDPSMEMSDEGSNIPTSSIHWDWLEMKEAPRLIATCCQEFQSSYENYLRGCAWSPDGSLLVTNSDDNILRIFESPSFDDVILDDNNTVKELKPTLRMSEGESVYDHNWYPYMTSQDPDTCCFLATSRDHPIHLWDTNSGRIRCSYRAFDQMDELASAHSVSFNIDGSKIYAGFNNCIRIFDSARPGRDFVEKTTIHKKNRSRKDRYQTSLNQRGIISCIAFSNQYSGLYALGSFSKTVGLYAANDDEPLFLLKEHTGGITQLKFTTDGFYLISGARKDGELIAWDMRNTSYPLFKMNRTVNTNQCVQFDVDKTCQYLCSGNTNGDISIWNIHNIMLNVGDDVINHDPFLTFQGHDDAVNGLSLHHSSKSLATTSGQRHFVVNDNDSDDDTNAVTMETDRFVYDNSLKIWHL